MTNRRSLARAALIPLAALATLSGACSGTSGPSCLPNAQVDCVCPSGAHGVQTCAADGHSLSTCTCAPAPTGTTVGATTPAPAAALTFVPLRHPWTRLWIDSTCDEEYASLVAESEMTWHPPGGPAIRLTVHGNTTYEQLDDDDWHVGVQETALSLRGEQPGRAAETLAQFRTGAAGATCAERQSTVVYVGERVDGTILVSLEALPQHDRMQLPGTTRRAVIAWDTAAGTYRSLGHWDGETARVPPEFRIRAGS